MQRFFVIVALLVLAAGCATNKQTESMLGAAGFHRIAATTPGQLRHLKTLPPDKLTVAKIKGKTYYVFPDPAHNLIYLGNTEEYQTYKEILSDRQLEGQNRVEAEVGQASGADDDAHWVEWTSDAGWTSGNF